jgi:hypothetical protein
MPYPLKLLLIGNRGGTNVAECFERAAVAMGVEARIIEASAAMGSIKWLNRVNWWLRGRRPTHLKPFGRALLTACRRQRPDLLISTGTAPITATVLRSLGLLGVRRVSFLTDDPWNPAHYAPWFLRALPEYDYVFTPRHANQADLQRLGCPNVGYLPFAYDPSLHYSAPPSDDQEHRHYDCDVLFIGTGDRDRAPIIGALDRNGFRVGLYGSYWERYAETRHLSRGQADVRTLRQATSSARVALCLVRRANRDGHVMRSFEIPAIGACMLTEDTPEHRAFFGAEGDATVYFSSTVEMLAKLRRLVDSPSERERLAKTIHQRITGGAHTYESRLAMILALTGLPGHVQA